MRNKNHVLRLTMYVISFITAFGICIGILGAIQALVVSHLIRYLLMVLTSAILLVISSSRIKDLLAKSIVMKNLASHFKLPSIIGLVYVPYKAAFYLAYAYTVIANQVNSLSGIVLPTPIGSEAESVIIAIIALDRVISSIDKFTYFPEVYEKNKVLIYSKST